MVVCAFWFEKKENFEGGSGRLKNTTRKIASSLVFDPESKQGVDVTDTNEKLKDPSSRHLACSVFNVTTAQLSVFSNSFRLVSSV